MTHRRNVSEAQAPSAGTPTLVADDAATSSVALKASQGIRQDLGSIALLLLLYTLQGLPMGLAASVPLLLQEQNVSYKQQSLFSLVSWPFSLKLLWAPIVDSIYSSRMGRRKSWLVPVQLVMGAMMLFLGGHVDAMVRPSGPGAEPNVFGVTVFFFVMFFLAATQDIAVDGWALTMLSRQNVGYASTCNAIGQTVGYVTAYLVFLALNSPEFCNSYLRPSGGQLEVGVITMASFMRFWGAVFLLTTLSVWALKQERPEQPEQAPEPANTAAASGEGETEQDVLLRRLGIDDDTATAATATAAAADTGSAGVLSAYRDMVLVIRRPAVQRCALFLLTAKVAFSATDAVATLKLMEKGMPKQDMAWLSMVMTPISLLLPAAISRYTAGPRPLRIYLWAFPLRLAFAAASMALIYNLPTPDAATGATPPLPYGAILFITAGYQVAMNMMFVSQMSFFARVSDPAMGGTYMTLLNTLANLGAKWPNTLALAAVDPLTIKTCAIGAENPTAATATARAALHGSSCVASAAASACAAAGGTCVTQRDGFYALFALCCALGLLWLLLMAAPVHRLQLLPLSDWRCAAAPPAAAAAAAKEGEQAGGEGEAAGGSVGDYSNTTL